MGNTADSALIGAIEMGSHKVVTLIGQIVRGQTLHVIGQGECTSRGIKKGEVVDFHSLCNAVHASIHAAEQNAGVRIDADQVYLSVTSHGLQGRFNYARTQVSDADSLVQADDVKHLHDDAKRRQLPEGRIYMHHIQNPLFLDGKQVADAVGKKGEVLEVSYWSIDADEAEIAQRIRIINGYSFRVRDLIVNSLASAAVVANEEAKRKGCLVIDMGAGCTDFVLYRQGYIVHTGVLPIGGDHLSNDLSIGLRINHKAADKLKCDVGKAILDRADRHETMMLYGDYTIGDTRIRRHAINQILHARVEEIFELILKSMGDKWDAAEVEAGVLLTGGSSRLMGIAETAEATFGVPAALAEMPDWVDNELREPEYATVLGLLHYALTGFEESLRKKPGGGLLKRVAQVADRIFQIS